MKIIPRPKLKSTTIRVWFETRSKLNALAKYYKIPMTRLLDQVLDNIIKANDIPFDEKETN